MILVDLNYSDFNLNVDAASFRNNFISSDAVSKKQGLAWTNEDDSSKISFEIYGL